MLCFINFIQIWRTFISHQRHSNTAAYSNYLISLKISLSYGGEGRGGGVRCLWLWGEMVMGFFGPFFEHQSRADTGGSSAALHISHWLPHPIIHPPRPSHRTCSCTIKVRELQSDDSNGRRWECKWQEKERGFCSCPELWCVECVATKCC